MTAPSSKQLVLQAVQQLPDDASIEDAMERLYVLASIERGRADIVAGRVVSHDEVRRRLGLDDAER
jgi:predicted transcriptional regulator